MKAVRALRGQPPRPCRRRLAGAHACAILVPGMLYVFFGKDSFSLRERLDELRASLDADGMLATSTSVPDGRRATLAEVTGACDAAPFMCAHRLGVGEGL